MPRLLAIAIVLVLAVAAPASAASPWSEPETLPGSSGAASASIEFGPGGHGLLSLGKSGSISEPGGSFGAPRPLVSRFFLFAERHSMALERGDRFLAVGYLSAGRGSGIAELRGTLGGRIGEPRLVPLRGGVHYAFAGNSRGDAALLLQVSQNARDRRTRRHIFLLTRRAGRSFGRPIEIAGGGRPATLAVAINSRRQALAVWARDGRAAARVVSASGRRGRARSVPGVLPGGQIGAALVTSGRAVVTGTTPFGGESPPPRPGTYTLSIAPPDGAFRSQVLETTEVKGRSGWIGAVHQLVTGRDRVLLGWTGQTGVRATAKVAEVTATGLGPVRVLSRPSADSSFGRLLLGPGGLVAAQWFEHADGEGDFPGDPTSAEMAVRRPGAESFDRPEQIVGPGNRLGLDLAIDPTSGRMTAVWAEFAAGSMSIRLTSRPAVAGG